MTKSNGTAALKTDGKFTLDQWKAWPDDERCELIGGIAYCMSPAPLVKHQKTVLNLAKAICDYLQGKPCQPFIAPVDVFLPAGIADSPDTVVQPDVMVVCDQDKVGEDGIHGAPDFVAEVLSESTAYKDLNQKKAVYERSGVREYWVINPDSLSVFCFILQDGKYLPVTEIMHGEPVTSLALPGFIWRA